jgi:hypothetical protein
VTINAENLFGRGQHPERIEIPAAITVGVVGAAQPDALPSVAPPPAPPAIHRPPRIVHESAGTAWGVVVLVALVALALGAAAGALAGRRRSQSGV